MMITPVFPLLCSTDRLPLMSDARYKHRFHPDNGFAICQKLKLKVFLDGEEVTDRCFFFDRTLRMVGLYKRNKEGQFYVEFGTIASEWREGDIALSL